MILRRFLRRPLISGRSNPLSTVTQAVLHDRSHRSSEHSFPTMSSVFPIKEFWILLTGHERHVDAMDYYQRYKEVHEEIQRP